MGYESLPDMQAKATMLGADGYVINPAVWNTAGSPYDMRYIAFTR